MANAKPTDVAASAADQAAGLLDRAATWAAGSDWLSRIAIALAIALVGMWLARLLARALDRVMGRVGMEQILRDFLRNIAYVVGLVVVFVAALDALGVPTTSLLAVLGAAGLAIGLALKDSLSNIASGVMLIVLRPFRAGDAVNIAGQEGIVERVRIFQTVIRAYQNHDVILPNSQITTSPIINYTARETRRMDIPVGIGYDDDIRKAREVLLALAKAHPNVLGDPAADVMVNGLGDSSVDLTLRAWARTPDYVTTRSDLVEAVHREFGEKGVSIPYPQRDLHVYYHDAEGRPLPAPAEVRDVRSGD